MKKTKKEDESYYAISAFLAVILTIVIHYFFISNLNIHPTIHIIISLFLFFLISAASSSILAKLWNKS